MLIREIVIGLFPVLCIISGCRGQKLDKNYTSYPNRGICGSINIMGGDPNKLLQLNNCSVIDGFLRITLLSQDISNYTFPDLREITEYFLMYRVYGLQSLGTLFPNLVLIRGQTLFHNYALILFDIAKLNQIGLRSLTTIMRGYVRIEQNTLLCYSQTVSWEIITGRAKGHYFSNNGNHLCPGRDSCRGCDHLCWSAEHCQKIPQDTCHPECIGCTNKHGLCYRCRHFNDNGVCVKTCGDGKFEHISSQHCVTLERCKEVYGGRGWTWNNTCINKCPLTYREVTENDIRSCVYCGDNCNTVCNGFEIVSYGDAQQLKGCNIINGSLEIQFMSNNHGEDVMQELEDSLGHVQEIMGFLKVYRTPAITSLNFLKSLTTIRGNILLHNRYAIAVNEMPNLEHLWNLDSMKNIRILNGTLFFHYNAKLCMDDIKKLGNITNSLFTSDDVCNNSNGYAARCRRELINVTSYAIGSRMANITWERIKQVYKMEFQMEYAVFYLEEPEIDVVTHNARDTCYSKDWNFLALSEFPNYPYPTHSVVLKNLQPYTKYAYYVETAYRNSSVPVNSYREGRSEIKYFITDMERPPMPVDINAFSLSSDSIIVYWKNPPSYKGVITHYLFEMTIKEDDIYVLDQRDYCISPPIREIPVEIPPVPDNPVEDEDYRIEVTPKQNCTCKEDWNNMIQNLMPKDDVENPLLDKNCVGTHKSGPIDEDEFVDRLICSNVTFSISNDDGIPRKPKHTRHEREFDIHKLVDPDSAPGPLQTNVSIDNVFHSFSTKFPGHYNNHTMKNLKHYTKYIIAIAACKGPDNYEDCGSFALFSYRTLKNKTADYISNFTLVVLNDTHVEIEWKEPANPNGAILSYNIEYTMRDDLLFKPIVYCLPRKNHEGNKGKFVMRIHPGEYAIRIRATSLGMTGEYSKLFNFTYEPSPNNNWVIVFFGTVLMIVATSLACWFIWKRRRRMLNFRSSSPMMQSMGIRWTNTDEGRVDLLHNFE